MVLLPTVMTHQHVQAVMTHRSEKKDLESLRFDSRVKFSLSLAFGAGEFASKMHCMVIHENIKLHSTSNACKRLNIILC
jgi:hypothetical protein